MSRWDYDTVFYRVFCITLLAVAFTFTVILTNVFVDIDGLLSKKEKVKPPKPTPNTISHDLSELSRAINVNMLPEDKSEDIYEDKDYQDSNDIYRSKRSLVPETPDQNILPIEDQKVKKLLTNHLANLLDEIDEQNNRNSNYIANDDNNVLKKDNNNKVYPENMKIDKYIEFISSTTDKNKIKEKEELKTKNKEEVISIEEYFKENKDDPQSNNDNNNNHKDYKAELVHLAMHNMILKGILENSDLEVVYKKVADLVTDFEKDHAELSKDELRNLFKNVKKLRKHTDTNEKVSSDELKHIDDLLLRRESGNRMSFMANKETTSENNLMQKTTTVMPKDYNVIIKTIIDITTMTNDKSNKESDLNAKDKINGIVKVIYNGHVIRFKRIDDDDKKINKKDMPNKLTGLTGNNGNHINRKLENNLHASNQSYYQKIFYDYLKNVKGPDSTEQENTFSKIRLKRHVKIRFENKKTTEKPKTKITDDDKLFVEIETHFNSKGMKGDQKKKLIKNLINKIQAAIHSDDNDLKKKHKHWKVKKRMQNPLYSKNTAALINKLIIPFETLTHRHLDPISKSVPVHEDMPLVNNAFGHNDWERPYNSPKFFGKSINSAELNMLDIDYNKVLRHNGIPQRLQMPLNTDMNDDLFQDSKVVDIGNIKFLMKNLDGTGFSIGFNQYTDEAPDLETMKLFSGLENVIQTYHQQYDQEATTGTRQENTFDNAKNVSPEEVFDNEEQVDNSDQHVIQRRSILNSKENDRHPNNYRIIYEHNIFPYKSYDEIYNVEKPAITKIKNMKVYRVKSAEKSAFFIDENVFEKKLKPSEIFSIADLLQRKKRSIKVKKISNVKIKSKINRYLNTKKMASKSVFMNKKQTKRSKRQIDKIRIIARDLPHQGKSEEENLFVVSDEKLFSDRSMIREIDLPEMEPNDKMHSIEHYDIVPPQKEEEPDEESQTQKANEDAAETFDVLNPYIYNLNPFDSQNEFSRRARHNSLMAKYPHIIMEETPSYEGVHGAEFLVDQRKYNIEATTESKIPTILDIPLPSEQELITDLISPPKDLSNYKVSVKIRPRHSSNMSGYKEVHTSINKSYNKNGLKYTSLVNVSQLSKVENFNKNITRRENDEVVKEQNDEQELKTQQNIIKTLIQQHKHRLEMQLKHLQIEKQKLDAMYNETPENITEKEKPKTRIIIAKKLRKSLQNEAKKKTTPEATIVETSTQTTATTNEPKTTITTTTTEYTQTTSQDVIKAKMIETIQRNENITNELLKKIDQNTGVLKIFLGKLMTTMDLTTTNDKTGSNINNESNTNNAVFGTKQPMPHDRIENSNIPFNFEDYHMLPNMLFKNLPRPTNNSYGIPFVYAVQHPYGASPNRDNMASMIYHGHIYTNAVVENNMKRDKKSPTKVIMRDKIKIVPGKKNIDTDFWKPKPGEKVIHDFVINKNNSRFFLEESRNDYKVSGGQAKNGFTEGGVNAAKV